MSLPFEDVVNQLVALGFSRDCAAAEARVQLGLSVPIPDRGEPDETILEKEEQAEVSKLFRSYGFTVRSTSQPRRSKIAPGIPDLWCTHNSRPIAFWWETKRQVGGKLSPAQVIFRDDCQRCNVGWGAGDRYCAETYLVGIGLAEDTGNGRIEPVRRSA